MKIMVLIADEMHPSLFEMLDKIDVEHYYFPKITREEIISLIPEYQGLIIRSKTAVDIDLLKNAANLKFIARAGAGLDLVDIDYCQKKNIALFTANEGNRDAVAEHTIGMILSLFNKINTANIEVKNGIWQREPNRGVELMGKTWGIIGYGNNGKATAQRLSGFGVKVVAFDKYKTNFTDNYTSEATMQDIFDQADIVSIHSPLTEHTHQLFDDNFINQFKKKFYLINIARGEIVILADLLKNIQAGKILGACLDVLENEKISKLNKDEKVVFDALAKLPNTVFTPHIAGWTQESYVKINEVLVDKIKYFVEGKNIG
jgi:D-3-phosphoglycerate dehydrogenase / 2-oxoglutarate reductase